MSNIKNVNGVMVHDFKLTTKRQDVEEYLIRCGIVEADTDIESMFKSHVDTNGWYRFTYEDFIDEVDAEIYRYGMIGLDLENGSLNLPTLIDIIVKHRFSRTKMPHYLVDYVYDPTGNLNRIFSSEGFIHSNYSLWEGLSKDESVTCDFELLSIVERLNVYYTFKYHGDFSELRISEEPLHKKLLKVNAELAHKQLEELNMLTFKDFNNLRVLPETMTRQFVEGYLEARGICDLDFSYQSEFTSYVNSKGWFRFTYHNFCMEMYALIHNDSTLKLDLQEEGLTFTKLIDLIGNHRMSATTMPYYLVNYSDDPMGNINFILREVGILDRYHYSVFKDLREDETIINKEELNNLIDKLNVHYTLHYHGTFSELLGDDEPLHKKLLRVARSL